MANQASVNEGSGGMTRREFLYYVWGASIALLTLQGTGLLIWYLIPRFREGEFGGKFPVPLDDLPEVNANPVNFADGRFWLVNLNSAEPNELMYQAPDETEPIIGVAAIYKVCTHLGCIYSWTPANARFECPCHGSKYRLDGRRIESPAPRSLDRFKMEAIGADGAILAESPINVEEDYYNPLVLPEGTVSLSIDTGSRKKGPTLPLLCSFANTCP